MLAHHQQRVVKERDELDERLGRLSEFIKSDVFPALSPDECALLNNQRIHMGNYLVTLNQRLALWTSPATAVPARASSGGSARFGTPAAIVTSPNPLKGEPS
jgi:hypothetical protein